MSEQAIEMVGAGATDPSLRLNTEGLVDEMRMSQNSLRTLADQTGGFAAVNANNLTPAFARIVQANSTYYVLGYYPPDHPRDGKFHQIEVRVKRPGLHVEARKGYEASRGKTAQEKLADLRKKVPVTPGAVMIVYSPGSIRSALSSAIALSITRRNSWSEYSSASQPPVASLDVQS